METVCASASEEPYWQHTMKISKAEKKRFSILPVTLAVYLCLPTIGCAQEVSKVNLVSDFWEIVRPAAEISGARIVGFAAIGELDRSIKQVTVTAAVPRDWAGARACLKVMSADGLYESLNTYAVSDSWDGGSVTLDYPSRQFDRLDGLPKEMLAALLVRGDCGAVSSEASPVLWGQNDKPDFRVMLNTSRADEAFIFFPDHPDIADIACEPAPFSGRSGFDTFCDLPRDLASSGQLKASIISFKNGEMGREEQVTLRLGARSQ